MRSTGLVLDIGKTHSRAVTFDADGSRLHVARWRTLGGHGVLDVERTFAGLAAALADNPARDAIRWLLPITHGAAGTLIGADGRVAPLRDYEAPIESSQSAVYDALRAPFGDTGSPSLPAGLNLGRQLHAILNECRALRAPGTRLALYPQYWCWRFCGELVAEVSSLGCHTDLWSPWADAPSPVLERLGLPGALPARVAAGEPLGCVAREIQALGLSSTVEILNGAHDSNASLAPFLDGDPPALLSTGTWGVAMAPLRAGVPGLARDPADAAAARARLDPERDMLVNVSVHGHVVPTARCMLGREREAVLELGGAQARPEPAVHDGVDAASCGIGGAIDWTPVASILRRGTFALPSFALGGGFATRRGSLVGLRPETATEWSALADLYAALLADDLLERVAPDRPAVVVGPIAGNARILGLLASLRDAPLDTVDDAIDTAYGGWWIAQRRERALAAPSRRRIGGIDAAACRDYRARWHALLAR